MIYFYYLLTSFVLYHVPPALLYCDPSCCPLIVLTVITLKLLPYRADYNMSESVTLGVNTAADLAKLRDEGQTLSSQELKELNTRVKALEEMARLEDRLRTLENRKRSRSAATSEDQLERQLDHQLGHQLDHQLDPNEHPTHSSSALGHRPRVRRSTELDDSGSSSSDTIIHPHKQRRYTKGIKVTP